MRISTKGRYGVRIMLELSDRRLGGPVSADTLASDQKISANYIHNLLSKLQTVGLVQVVRGPRGGYTLARDPDQVTLLEIVIALEGDLDAVECLSDDNDCERSGHCATQEVWREVSDAVANVLGGISLKDLRERRDTNEPDCGGNRRRAPSKRLTTNLRPVGAKSSDPL
jgi:Rrf2 family transcriptional regulator, cysteine metabolism repressor